MTDLVNTTAYLIDLCRKNSTATDDYEEKRRWALAATHYGTALMWATKAASYSKVPVDVK